MNKDDRNRTGTGTFTVEWVVEVSRHGVQTETFLPADERGARNLYAALKCDPHVSAVLRKRTVSVENVAGFTSACGND